MRIDKAQEFFTHIKPEVVNKYSTYWHSIAPKTEDDFLRRYLFAFTSVHTTWEANVRGYNALKDLGWVENKDDLRNRLINAKCGMHNNRTNYIWAFTKKFRAFPEYFTKTSSLFCRDRQDWASYRNDLVKHLNGLGITKVSFALEMCFPLDAEVSCIDTHGLKLYELDATKLGTKTGNTLYEQAESHWLERSKEIGASSTVTRAIFWDEKQKKQDSRYWTYVLED